MTTLIPDGDQAERLMHEQCWPEALACWQTLHEHDRFGSPEQFHAYAKCCEMLDRWELHQGVLIEALQRYPLDAGLRARDNYRQALVSWHACSWAEALQQLENLRNCNPTCWPFALSYYRWHALLMGQLAGLDDALERKALLAEASLFKNACVFSRQLAAFEWVIELASWNGDLKKEYLRLHRQLVHVFKNHDRQLAVLRTEPVIAAVGELAVFLRTHPAIYEDIPTGYLHFYARLLLMHGYTDLYLTYRNAFAARIAMGGEGSTGLVESLFRISCDNERALEQAPVFDQLHVGQLDAAACSVLGKALAVSELYQPAQVQGRYSLLHENSAFSELLADKSVAIVGPADVGLDSGQEIDSFDLVIRFNHRSGLQLDPRRFGNRTDISYYGSSSLSLHQSYLLSENHLQYLVVEELDLQRFSWLSQVRVPLREHLRAWSFDCPFLFGAPSAIQRTLMDILRFGPSRVKVFNMNFYLDIGYSGGYGSQSFNIFPALSIHDPLSNLIFAQKCMAAWGVESDAVLMDILCMPPEQYLERLWQSHRRFAR